MKSKTQTLGKKILVGGATLAMAGSMLATGIVAPFGASAWSSANGKWYSDFNNYAEATAFAEQIAVQIMGFDAIHKEAGAHVQIYRAGAQHEHVYSFGEYLIALTLP